MSTEIAKREAIVPYEGDKDYIKAVAMDIGKELAAYIEVMYPEAVKAASSTFLLSVKNHTYNEIMGWLETKIETGNRLAQRQAFRREWVGSYRKMRRRDNG